ncbi:Tim10/DDP family zinc finger-domain-containing protein [Globomyces pollinis-pini]|nr:Tim10/DDP family zinc finger-domain-containing protein [Globomyces pollinis-pini]
MSGLDSRSKDRLTKALMDAEKTQMFQSSVHDLTDLCWTKCITRIKSYPDKNDQVCVMNCVERFLDSTHIIMQSMTKNMDSK